MIVCNLIGKLFISTSYSMLYVFVGDFFPTLLRNQSYGASSLSSRILTMLVPFLIYLGMRLLNDFKQTVDKVATNKR